MLAGLKGSWKQLLHESKKVNRCNQKLYSLYCTHVKTDPRKNKLLCAIS